MFKEKPMRRLYQLRVEPCWDCGVHKVAIAYQSKTLYGRTQYRWLCQDCGQVRWVFPTLVLLARIDGTKEKSLKKSSRKTNVIAFKPRTAALSAKA